MLLPSHNALIYARPDMRRWNRDGTQGYSLLEMLIVLSIMALACVFVVNAFSNHGKLTQRQQAQALRTALASASQNARATGRDIIIRSDNPAFGAGVSFGPPQGGRPSTIIFRGDGSSSGAVVYISGKAMLRVDPLFGEQHAI